MSYQLVDLFAGAGGLSAGFSKAGFNIPVAVEQDLWASETYVENHINTKLIVKDIRSIPNMEFHEYVGADVVAGGPPCQGFSISASNRRKSDDPRNLLYLEFLRVVEIVNPKVVLIENVKEITKFRLPDGRLLCSDIQDRLNHLGYSSEILTLNASSFGVPQDRQRAFILGAKDSVRLKEAVNELNKTNNLFSDNKKILTLWDAISDLPEVTPWKVTESSTLSYAKAPQNSYQKELRGDFMNVINHVPMRHTQRIIERFKYIIENIGEEKKLLPKELSPRVRGNPVAYSEITYDQNHRMLHPSKPSPTITASFYSSFIHPFQPRNLTVREAARLQSFPDNYVFKGKRTTLSKKLLTKKGEVGDLYLDQFNQVGNSVPPLLAYCIANQIKRIIE